MRYTGLVVTMALTIGAGAYLGQWIDGRIQSEFPIWTIVLSLLSIGIALWRVVKDVSK